MQFITHVDRGAAFRAGHDLFGPVALDVPAVHVTPDNRAFVADRADRFGLTSPPVAPVPPEPRNAKLVEPGTAFNITRCLQFEVRPSLVTAQSWPPVAQLSPPVIEAQLTALRGLIQESEKLDEEEVGRLLNLLMKAVADEKDPVLRDNGIELPQVAQATRPSPVLQDLLEWCDTPGARKRRVFSYKQVVDSAKRQADGFCTDPRFRGKTLCHSWGDEVLRKVRLVDVEDLSPEGLQKFRLLMEKQGLDVEIERRPLPPKRLVEIATAWPGPVPPPLEFVRRPSTGFLVLAIQPDLAPREALRAMLMHRRVFDWLEIYEPDEIESDLSDGAPARTEAPVMKWDRVRLLINARVDQMTEAEVEHAYRVQVAHHHALVEADWRYIEQRLDSQILAMRAAQVPVAASQTDTADPAAEAVASELRSAILQWDETHPGKMIWQRFMDGTLPEEERVLAVRAFAFQPMADWPRYERIEPRDFKRRGSMTCESEEVSGARTVEEEVALRDVASRFGERAHKATLVRHTCSIGEETIRRSSVLVVAPVAGLSPSREFAIPDSEPPQAILMLD